MKTKFAIGCLIQWYECDIIGEYLETLKEARSHYGWADVIVDFVVCGNQDLEKAVSEEKLRDCITEISIKLRMNGFKDESGYKENIYTIADYRREFNDKFCDHVDVLVWGESDMLVPKQMFEVLDILHQNQSTQTPKYLATFGICKMWDDTWKPLEHIEFTNKPMDNKAWWGSRYTMNKDEMNEFNDKVTDLDVTTISPHKFNGCGLVISSEVVKAGVNIPKSTFFTHEDTAFMLMTQKVLGLIPQYHFRNILLVHNREHPNKRNYVSDENGKTLGERRKSNNWYEVSAKMSEQNTYNLFNPNWKSKTWKDVWSQIK